MPKRSVSTTKALRQANRNRIFKFLHSHKDGCTKQEVANALKISLPTVTQNLIELMEIGVLKYDGSAQSSGGRKARLITVDENSRYAIGISMTKRHLRFVAVGFNANKLAYKKTEFNFSACVDISGFIASELEEFIAGEKLCKEKLLGVRVTVPGIVNLQQEIVEFVPTLQANPISIENLLQKIPYKCSVENDATAGGFAELWNKKDGEGFVYISLDRGVGGSIFLNGSPYVGNNSRSGEFGHICIHANGIQCSCGRSGCLEAYCSTEHLSTDLNIGLETFFLQLDNNIAYKNLWQSYLKNLALGLQTIKIILDCQIMIGGAVAPHLAPYLSQLQEEIEVRELPKAQKSVLSLSSFGADSNCVGAALHYIARFIENI